MVERVEPKEQRLSLDVIPYVELPPPSPPRDRILDDDEVSLLREICPNLILNGAGHAFIEQSIEGWSVYNAGAGNGATKSSHL